MTNNILIKRNELQQQVDLKNFYLGESAKRKDADADTLQSSADDKELFVMFTRKTLNELISVVALRFSSIKYDINKEYIEITFETNKKPPTHILPLLKQAIINYLINDLTLQWLQLRSPMMAQPYFALRNSLYENVQQLFAKIINTHKTRRRATDLAGI